MRQALSDGSYLSHLSRRGDKSSGIPIGVIEYALPDAEGVSARYRLLTSLLDEKRAPALELAALYHERWEVEGVFDELKTHLHQRRRVLRSKTPNLVYQEFYAWVLAHYAVRWLMFSAVGTDIARSAADFALSAAPDRRRRSDSRRLMEGSRVMVKGQVLFCHMRAYHVYACFGPAH